MTIPIMKDFGELLLQIGFPPSFRHRLLIFIVITMHPIDHRPLPLSWNVEITDFTITIAKFAVQN
jgi:hypothetical protein